MNRTILTVLAAVACGSAASAGAELNGIEFVSSFRTMKGAEVTISDCKIGGTTAEFIRCETANGSASYALFTDTMDPDDIKWALSTCPTGSVRNPDCKVRVRGVVNNRDMPSLKKAQILR